jgi:hypothetical protein
MSSPVLGGADFGKPSCFPLGPSIEGTALIRLVRARSARICPPSASNNRWLISDGLLVVLNPEMMLLFGDLPAVLRLRVDSGLVRCCLTRVGRFPIPILSGTFHNNVGAA